jgi:MFS family permease
VIGVAAVASLGLVRDVVRAVKPTTTAVGSPSLPRPARLYLLAVALLSTGSLPMGVLLFKTQDLGIAGAAIPLFYAVYNVTYAAFSWPAGRLADRIDTGLVIVLGYALLIVAYVVLSFASAVWILVVGFLLLGGFSAFTDGVQRSYLSHLVDEEHKGTAFGYLNGAVGLGVLLAGVAGGYLWQHAGDRVTLLVAATVVLCGLIVFGAGRRFGPSRLAAD